jgi:hypothetical protein
MTSLPANGWHYPLCVAYSDEQILAFFAEAGLSGISISWYHPAASWYMAALSQARLPNDQERLLLTGAVIAGQIVEVFRRTAAPEALEIGSLGKLGDAQLGGPGPRLPIAVAVA